MSKKRIIFIILIVFVVVLIFSGVYLYQKVISSKNMVEELFQMNSDRRAEGYYMAEFEMKMVGILYHLDKGQYNKALTFLENLHHQLKSGEGLIKVPNFSNKKEELAFYLDLQSPKTGAFMDDSYPFCTYFPTTLNVIDHLEYLADSIGQPLKLKYPLKFLEQLDSPEEVRTYLDDLSTVGWLVSKMPKTPHVLSSLVSYDDLERLNLHTFSDEWKKELVKWHWENQDSTTGYWGVRLRSNGKLLKGGDLTMTPKFIKLLVNRQGQNRYKEFPLRYKNEMANSTINKLKTPMPENLSEQHEWSIDRNFAIKLLTYYLWDDLSIEQKAIIKEETENLVQTIFSEFYIFEQGAFSLYPGQKNADLDGTSMYLGLLKKLGVASDELQEKLWGSSNETMTNLGVFELSQLAEKDFSALMNVNTINSIRLYSSNPGINEFLSEANAVIYPRDTEVLDFVDVAQNIDKWILSTTQNMGNWVSKEALKEKLGIAKIKTVPVFKGDFPLEFSNSNFKEKKNLIAIGFDVLQIPRYKLVYKYKKAL
jgi:hypothetical protein